MNFAIQYKKKVKDGSVSEALICFYDKHFTIEYPFIKDGQNNDLYRRFECEYKDIDDSRYDDTDEILYIRRSSDHDETSETEHEISVPMSCSTAERVAGVLRSFKVHTDNDLGWY